HWSGVVRVSAAKLDSLLAQSSELLAIRHRAAAGAEAARALQEVAGGWPKEWRRIGQQFTRLLTDPVLPPDLPLPDELDAEPPRRRVERVLSQHKATMSRFARDIQRLATELSGDHRALEQAAQRIDTEVHRVRMLPFAEACEGLDRMVRDLAASSNKRADVA